MLLAGIGFGVDNEARRWRGPSRQAVGMEWLRPEPAQGCGASKKKEERAEAKAHLDQLAVRTVERTTAGQPENGGTMQGPRRQAGEVQEDDQGGHKVDQGPD